MTWERNNTSYIPIKKGRAKKKKDKYNFLQFYPSKTKLPFSNLYSKPASLAASFNAA